MPRVSVVDVACGSGCLVVQLARKLPEATMTGIDGSEGMLKSARAKVEESAVRNVRFLRADAGALPLDDRSVDGAVSAHVLEWLRDPLGAITEQVCVTRPGGVVTAQLGSWGRLVDLYPDCPNVEKLWNALLRSRDPGRRPSWISASSTDRSSCSSRQA